VKHYSIYYAPLLSFYSKSFYRDVGMRHKGIAVFYLLLIVAAFTIVPMLKLKEAVSLFKKTEFSYYVEQMPVITITQGKLSIDEPVPYVIRDLKSDRPVVIIDTSGGITSLQGKEARVLITQKSIFFRQSATKTESYNFDGIKSLTVDREKMYEWMNLADRWLAIAAFPFAALFLFGTTLIQVLLYGVIGLFFARIAKVQLDSRALLRLAVISITPALIIDAYINFRGIVIPYWPLLTYLIDLGYLYFAINANAAPSRPSAGVDAPPPLAGG